MSSPERHERVSVHLVASYPVRWSEFAILRDFLQNFFDAAGPQDFDAAVSIVREQGSTLIDMNGQGFALDWLLHIGASTKTGGAPGSTAGYFGEGFKIAALCALRDFAWRIEMGSREWSAEAILAPDFIDGTPVPPSRGGRHEHGTRRVEGLSRTLPLHRSPLFTDWSQDPLQSATDRDAPSWAPKFGTPRSSRNLSPRTLPCLRRRYVSWVFSSSD